MQMNQGCIVVINGTIQKFQEELEASESSISRANGMVQVTADVNGKSPEWGETRLDKRGNAISEMIARNVVAMNNGQEYIFRRGDAGSIINLTMLRLK